MSIAKNTSYNFVGALIPLAISIVTIPIYLKLVGIERYGVLSISWIFLGYFGLFDLGLGRATTQRIAVLKSAPAQQSSDTFWTALCLNIAIGVIGACALWAATAAFFGYGFKLDAQLRAEAVESLPLLALSVPVATITGVLTGALQGRERFASVNLVSTLSTAAFQILPLLLVMMVGPRLIWVLSAAVMTRIIAALILWYRCRNEFLADTKPVFNRAEVKSLLKFGGWVTVTSMCAPLLVMVDRVFIGGLIGAQAVATYSIAIQLAQRMTMLAQALTGATYPRLAGLDRAAADSLSIRSTETLVVILTPSAIIAIFLCGPFLRLWLGSNFDPLSVPISQLMIMGFWINSLAFVPFVRLQAVGRPDLVSYALMAQLPIYLGLLWLGMTRFGLLGSAIALALRLVIDYALLSVLARQLAAAKLSVISLIVLLLAFSLAPRDGSIELTDAAFALGIVGLSMLGFVVALGMPGLISLIPARLRPSRVP